MTALLSAGAHSGGIAGFAGDFAAARAQGIVRHVLDVDNDTLLLNRNDGFYSNGIRYTQVYTQVDSAGATSFAWRIGQELYTASDIKLPPELVGPPNHPYAAWLYGGVYKETQRTDGTRMRVGVDVGCLGPCAGGEWTQTNFHRLISQPLPRGWSRQVKNEVGVVLYADVAPVRWAPAKWLDLAPGFSGRFGNIFTDLGGRMVLRAGHLDLMPADAAFYGFVRTELHAVAYNATLQGGYFSTGNPHTVSPRRFVGEAELGVAWKSGRYAANAGVVRRSNEIRDLPDSVGAQNFVRLQFSYTP